MYRGYFFHYDSPGWGCNEVAVGNIPKGQIIVRYSDLALASGDPDSVTINMGDLHCVITETGSGYETTRELPKNLLNLLKNTAPNLDATKDLEARVMNDPDSIFQRLPYGY